MEVPPPAFSFLISHKHPKQWHCGAAENEPNTSPRYSKAPHMWATGVKLCKTKPDTKNPKHILIWFNYFGHSASGLTLQLFTASTNTPVPFLSQRPNISLSASWTAAMQCGRTSQSPTESPFWRVASTAPLQRAWQELPEGKVLLIKTNFLLWQGNSPGWSRETSWCNLLGFQ